MPRSTNRLTKKRKGIGRKPRNLQSSTETDSTSPSCSASNTCHKTTLSSSKKNLSKSDWDKYECNDSDVYEFINIDIFSEVLAKVTLCKSCKSCGLQLRNTKVHVGVASQLELYCPFCDFSEKFYNSKKVDNSSSSNIFDINIRLVYALRSIRRGQKAGQMLCGVLNVPQPPSKFSLYNKILSVAIEDVAENSMKQAIEEAVDENRESETPRDISAAFDGTWQKRGFRSLNGVVTCTSVDTGKVIDVETLTKYCTCSDKTNHSDTCQKNYEGPSGGMEVQGVKAIFKRSVEKYNVRYVNYLGDGDTKSFLSVEKDKPYGDVQINKLECLGHVQKRMGARLRKLKQEKRGVPLSDGLSLGGRNRLTDAAIDQLQSYYGLAIRNHTDNLEDMRKAVWAIYFHKLSTNEKPIHGLCPSGETSWCKHNKALAVNGPAVPHRNNLPESVMEVMKPIFRDLSQPELLKKCLHGKTQNANESVNNVIWTRIPKNVFVSMATLKCGVADAVASFNDGNISKCEVLCRLGIQPGKRTVESMKNLDRERMRDAENSITDFERQARRERRLTKKRLAEDFEEMPAYDPGMY
jgi:hypothetical protein